MKKSEQKTSWQKSVSKTKLKSFSVICWYNTQIGCVGKFWSGAYELCYLIEIEDYQETFKNFWGWLLFKVHFICIISYFPLNETV